MKAKQLQENNVDIAPVTHEDIVFDSNGKNIPNKYQTKEDNALDTTNKTIVGAINELFQNVSSGKELIATAITDKGVTTSSDDTFQTMADNIRLIEGSSSSSSNLPSWCPNFWIEGEPSKVAMGLSSVSINNEIYLIGGRDYDSVSATYYTDVNAYNIEKNTWSKKTTIPTPRCWLTSDVINNKIYSIGGYASTGAINTNECYDPLTNTWSSKTSSPWNVFNHTSSVVDNNIYLIGGQWGDNTSNNYCYDTLTDTWSAKAKTSTNRYKPTSNAIGDKIYCMGGYVNNVYDDNLCYDTLTDTWSTKSSMLTATYGLVSEVINNKIYCIGGSSNLNPLTLKDTIEVYDVNTDSWKEEGSIKTPRYDFTSEMINDIIYTFCGYTTTSLNITEGYVVAEDIKLGSEEVRSGKKLIATAITNKGVTTSSNDSFQTMADNIGLIETKTNGGNINLPSWYEESLKNKWTSILASTQRGGLTASSVGDNIYAIGGHFNDYLNQNYKYNTQENTWISMTTMPTAEAYLTSQSIDNKIYCMGGYNGEVKGLNQCYDTITNTWSSKTAYNIGYHLTSSKISNKIYVIGGYSISTIRKFNYYYDPSTDTWSTKTNMPTARYKCSASSVGSNIYVIGGTTSSQTYSQVVECYDSLTDTWSTKANVSYPTIGLSSEAIGKKIYVFGGLTTDAIYSASTYCYDISTDIWTEVYTMNSRRAYFGTAVVNNNIYVICGETTDGNKLKLSEFYIPN